MYIPEHITTFQMWKTVVDRCYYTYTWTHFNISDVKDHRWSLLLHLYLNTFQHFRCERPSLIVATTPILEHISTFQMWKTVFDRCYYTYTWTHFNISDVKDRRSSLLLHLYLNTLQHFRCERPSLIVATTPYSVLSKLNLNLTRVSSFFAKANISNIMSRTYSRDVGRSGTHQGHCLSVSIWLYLMDIASCNVYTSYPTSLIHPRMLEYIWSAIPNKAL